MCLSVKILNISIILFETNFKILYRSKKLPSYIPYRENDDPEERMKRLLSEGRSEAMKHITSTKMV